LHDVEFSIATLVRLFRNIKNVKSYDFYIYVSHSLGINGIYLLVVSKSPENLPVNERFRACFSLLSLIKVSINTRIDVLAHLDSTILEVLISMSLKESDSCRVQITKEKGQLHFYANGTTLITTVQDDADREIVTSFETITTPLDSDDFRVVMLPAFPKVVEAVATMPFDSYCLVIQIIGDEAYLVIIDEQATRMISIKQDIDFPVDIDKVSTFTLFNIKNLYDICGHLQLTHYPTFLSDVLQDGTTADDHMLEMEYTSFSLRRKEIHTDAVTLYTGNMTHDEHLLSSTETFKSVMEGYDNIKYQFALTPTYIGKLYKKSQDITANRIEFLDIGGPSYIDCRDLSWLNRLAKKYGTLNIDVSGKFLNVLRTEIPELGHIYLTIYREVKRDVITVEI